LKLLIVWWMSCGRVGQSVLGPLFLCFWANSIQWLDPQREALWRLFNGLEAIAFCL
jgi:hypothetical protein